MDPLSHNLKESLRDRAPDYRARGPVDREHWLMDEAYKLGADAELEACEQWVSDTFLHGTREANQLRASRRPKPLTRKQKVLNILEKAKASGSYSGLFYMLRNEDFDALKKELEALPE